MAQPLPVQANLAQLLSIYYCYLKHELKHTVTVTEKMPNKTKCFDREVAEGGKWRTGNGRSCCGAGLGARSGCAGSSGSCSRHGGLFGQGEGHQLTFQFVEAVAGGTQRG